MPSLNINGELQLVDIHPSHAPEIFNLINTNRLHFREWLRFVDETTKPQDSLDFINSMIGGWDNFYGEMILSIVYQHQIVGVIGLKKTDWADRIAEIGYWIDPFYQGHGIISESCRALIEYAFAEKEVNRIEIKCGVGNDKSSHIPQRLGFVFEGIEREGEFINGKFIDISVYSLLKHDWVEDQKKQRLAKFHFNPN
jgi:ribosomal-protein-serine acetyltransferase